jgi:hypothetical protein
MGRSALQPLGLINSSQSDVLCMQAAFPEIVEQAGCSVDSNNEKAGGWQNFSKKKSTKIDLLFRCADGIRV